MGVDVLQNNVLTRLSIQDLLSVSGTCKTLYGIARNNACWARHKRRLEDACPPLRNVFDAHTVQQPKAKRARKTLSIGKRTCRGWWYVIVRILGCAPKRGRVCWPKKWRRVANHLWTAFYYMHIPNAPALVAHAWTDEYRECIRFRAQFVDSPHPYDIELLTRKGGGYNHCVLTHRVTRPDGTIVRMTATCPTEWWTRPLRQLLHGTHVGTPSHAGMLAHLPTYQTLSAMVE